MFTGIIETTGVVRSMAKNRSKTMIRIHPCLSLRGLTIGGSVACNGICLTVIRRTTKDFAVELMPETMRVTTLGRVSKGDVLNLELPLKAGVGVDGHFVAGHIDGVGIVTDISSRDEDYQLTIKPPKRIMKYVAARGSIAVDGISLTVSRSSKDRFSVHLIEQTRKVTNVPILKKGSRVNIEVDLIARYIEQLNRQSK